MIAPPHASVAVGVPGPGTPVGLHPRLLPGGQNVNVGGVTSTVHVNVCVHVPVLPHASTAVHVLVTVRIQPVPVSGPVVIITGIGAPVGPP